MQQTQDKTKYASIKTRQNLALMPFIIAPDDLHLVCDYLAGRPAGLHPAHPAAGLGALRTQPAGWQPDTAFQHYPG